MTENNEMELRKHGYQIGDTVYLDGIFEVVIDPYTRYSTNIAGIGQIVVSASGDSLADYFREDEREHHRGIPKVLIPCSLGDFTDRRLSPDEQTAWRKWKWTGQPIEKIMQYVAEGKAHD